MRFLMSLLLTSLSMSIVQAKTQAYDIENARQINKSCALCHGAFGQGTPDALSPRLAGLPVDYQIKELKLYRDGTRVYDPMVMVAGLKQFSDKDIRDISEYLADVNLEQMSLPEIPLFKGDADKGYKIFKRECKICHLKTGKGKARKGIPMVSGQYGNYLFNQLKRFQHRDRYHDNDPEDDLFDEYDDETLNSLVAYLTRLTNEQQQERTLIAQKQENIRLAKIKTEIIAKREAQSETIKAAATLPELEAKLAIIAEQERISMIENENMLEIQTRLSELHKNKAGTSNTFAGRFEITAKGNIILSPNHKDIRELAGVSGIFRADKKGVLEFVPDP